MSADETLPTRVVSGEAGWREALAFGEHLRALWRQRELLAAWTEREVRVRYKQSLIGGLWAILQPVSLMVVFTVIFSFVARVPTGDVPYPLFSYVALLPWTFFSTSITFAVPSLVSNMNLITKVHFPREVLPAASVAAAMVDFSVASLAFLPLLLFYGVTPTPALLWLAPLLLVQIALTLGLVLFLSALNVFYRDVRFVLPLVTQLWLYATPVIYPASLVPEAWRPLYNLNPMAAVIEGYRNVVLHGTPPAGAELAQGALVAALALVGGYLYFKRYEGAFADVI